MSVQSNRFGVVCCSNIGKDKVVVGSWLNFIEAASGIIFECFEL